MEAKNNNDSNHNNGDINGDINGGNNGDINGVIIPQPACAACKHRRRKCPPDCLLAPYFPADKKDEFESVLKTCSLKSLKEMIKKVEAPEDRHIRVAEAVTWAAGCWEEGPVLGPAGKYLRVLRQVEELKRERAALRESLSNRLHQLARQPYYSPNGYVAYHHQDHSNGTLVYPQNYHLQAGPDPNGYQFRLPVQQQRLQLQQQQQHFLSGYQYCLPVQQQRLQLQQQQQHFLSGYQYCLPVQQQQLQLQLQQQQQRFPSGYQYYLPEQLHEDVFDDTQSEGSP